MKIEIKITKEVLRRSMWCGVMDGLRLENCVVAIAVRDIFPKALIGFNGICSTGWVSEDRIPDPDIELPLNATRFIRAFDSLEETPELRLSLPEFSFEIDVPDEVIERIGINEAKAILEKSETLSLVET